MDLLTSRRFDKSLLEYPVMLAMLRDLVQHKGHANASLLSAIRKHDRSAHDEELRRLLHHILLANRFWLHLSLGQPFALEEESELPDSLEVIIRQYRETHVQEWEWLSRIQETDLAKRLETPHIHGHTFSVAEGLMQVCMHSQGHRSQCATRLRLLGGTPPPMDFILWLKHRPTPDWP
jgi:uncharacterized damage-inducible protein DinB